MSVDANWEFVVAAQKLFEIEAQYEYALWHEFGIGNDPSRRGIAGFHGGVSSAAVHISAQKTLERIEALHKQLNYLRTHKDNLDAMTMDICRLAETYRKRD